MAWPAGRLLGHQNLLAMIDRDERRSPDTIDAICRRLEPLGDTPVVVVHLQRRVATTGDALETIHRNRQLVTGDCALFQQKRRHDVIPPEMRTEHATQ